MTPTHDYLEKLKKLDKEATPGPWQGENQNIDSAYCIEGISEQCRVDVVVNNSSYEGPNGIERKADAAFIAESRTAIPRLIKIIERQQNLAVFLINWAESHLAEMECHKDGDCDHCVGLNLIKITKDGLFNAEIEK